MDDELDWLLDDWVGDQMDSFAADVPALTDDERTASSQLEARIRAHGYDVTIEPRSDFLCLIRLKSHGIKQALFGYLERRGLTPDSESQDPGSVQILDGVISIEAKLRQAEEQAQQQVNRTSFFRTTEDIVDTNNSPEILRPRSSSIQPRR